MVSPGVRPERSFEQFSRGVELTRAILRMWEANAQDAFGGDPRPPRSEVRSSINRRVSELMAEFDLTAAELDYWADMATELRDA